MKHYIEVFYPGSFFSESSAKEISSRDTLPEIGEKAFGYRFFDRESTMQNGEELLGKAKNYSNSFYIGEELSAVQAIARHPGNSILKSNIECNGYARLVLTKFGQLLPLEENDVVITSLNQGQSDAK